MFRLHGELVVYILGSQPGRFSCVNNNNGSC